MLIAAPLCVVAIAASVAVAAPSDAEKSQGPRLDELHAVRPIAAINVDDSASLQARIVQDTQDVQEFFKYVSDGLVKEYVDSVVVKEYVDSVVVSEYVNSVIAAEQQARAAAPRQVSSSVYSNSNPGSFLSCVRQRESSGNYGVYNAGGSGAAGAYQFMPSTWNSIARSVGRGDLVGMDPAQAAPADQDAMAQALYAQQGSAPWGGACG
jgi:hypothetical protein